MFKWTRTERAVRTKWRVTSYILFRHIVICAFQEADEVKCQYTQLKLSRQSNHPTLSLQPMAQRESEWRGIPAMTPCLGKAWKSQTAKSYKSITNAWLVWQNVLRQNHVVEFGKRDSNMFKLLSSWFNYLLTPQCLRLLQCWLCRWHLKNSSNMLPQPKSTFQDTFQVWSVTNIFLPFMFKALSIRIQNCVDGFCHKCKPSKTCIFYICHHLSS